MPNARTYEAAGTRAALRYHVEAALGGRRHVRGAPWALDRAPFHHMLPPWGEPQAADLDLPRDARTGEPIGEPGPLPPATTRPPTRGLPGGCDYEQRSYVLRILGADGTNIATCTSTPTLPVPCVIVGCSVHVRNGADPIATSWGLNVVTADVEGQFDIVPGYSLFTTRRFSLGPAEPAFWTPDTPMLTDTGTLRIAPINHTTQLIGALITEPGARLCFAVRGIGDVDRQPTLHITVRSLSCEQATTTVRTTTARAAAAPAPAPAIAPAIAPTIAAAPLSTAEGRAGPLREQSFASTPGMLYVGQGTSPNVLVVSREAAPSSLRFLPGYAGAASIIAPGYVAAAIPFQPVLPHYGAKPRPRG